MLKTLDKKLIWHPLCYDEAIPIIAGEGAYLYGEDGKKYLDLIASWWVNLHGHSEPYIADAIYRQALLLEHAIFADFTHQPAVELCERLSTLLPETLHKFFFSDNGSTAVEVALKMAYQYWHNHGDTNRTVFLSFDGGYHGDTLGAMSMGKTSGFHDVFKKLFLNVENIPHPHTWMDDPEVDEKEENAFQYLKNYLEIHADKVVCFILEPLMQGASGMRMCRAEFLRRVIDLLKTYNIIVIFDEVMTGFGRTGTIFAHQQIDRVPDILCVSKGLTGGFLPLALTITTQSMYDAFGTEPFLHSHSYTGNPLGCAAGLASLDLLLDPKTQEKIKDIENLHKEWLPKLNVTEKRSIGTISAFNLPTYDIKEVKKYFLEKGILIRPLNNTVYFLPPYCIDLKDLDNAYKIMVEFLCKTAEK